MEVNIYVGFWTLKVKCTQCVTCGQVAFKNTRAMVFPKPGGTGRSFRSGPENLDFFLGAALARKAHRGRFNVPVLYQLTRYSPMTHVVT